VTDPLAHLARSPVVDTRSFLILRLQQANQRDDTATVARLIERIMALLMLPEA
jgi:hypothetical protein